MPNSYKAYCDMMHVIHQLSRPRDSLHLHVRRLRCSSAHKRCSHAAAGQLIGARDKGYHKASAQNKPPAGRARNSGPASLLLTCHGTASHTVQQ
jgi:hypothetical protein